MPALLPVIVNNIFQYNFPLIKIRNALVFRRGGVRPIYVGLKSQFSATVFFIFATVFLFNSCLL